MKKLYILLLILVLCLSGCAKKPKETDAEPIATPVSSAEVTATPLPSPNVKEEAPVSDSQAKKNTQEKSPSFEQFENLTKELEKTTDEAKRRELLDKIQVILEQVESKE